MKFKLKSDFKPTGDQPEAINTLVENIKNGKDKQVLLGVTGSGKTFTIAQVIERLQKPVLVISHNKTLAAQLYQEFRDFFPDNAVSYFVSYYDYYQPEAYIPQTDTYIEKETQINEEIDKMRLAATTNLLTRRDTIVISSVSCIYNLGSPMEYSRYVLEISNGQNILPKELFLKLADLQYERSDYGFHRSSYRVKGDIVDVYPSYQENGLKIEFLENQIVNLYWFDPITGKQIGNSLEKTIIYPAKHFVANPEIFNQVFPKIKEDLNERIKELKKENKILEAHRLNQKVNYDLEMIKEIGYVNGIENYSRYFDGRKNGDPPYSLLEYFIQPYLKDWLLVIDESHMTIPQIRAMHAGDTSRKKVLIDYGFRLPAALDNRPLRFEEFQRRQSTTIYVSATPDEWEINDSQNNVIEQLVRPTGIPDPIVKVKKTKNQIIDLIKEINKRVKKHERTLITTLTKKMAEELSEYLKNKNFRVHYLHSEIDTLKRTDILDSLREGVFDVLVGINLLREGLDLPEVSLIAIIDADKEGFLRSKTSLIQTMGRAARNLNSQVIMYADTVTESMRKAISEVKRRRKYQLNYNRIHNIKPYSIIKPIRSRIIQVQKEQKEKEENKTIFQFESQEKYDNLTPADKIKTIKFYEKRMKEFAKILDFENASIYRDYLNKLKKNI